MSTIAAMWAGAGLVGLALLGVLVIKRGWGLILAKIKARAANAEAAAQAEFDKLAAPLLSRLAAIEKAWPPASPAPAAPPQNPAA